MIKIIVEHDSKQVSIITLRDKEANAFLDGEILKMQLGKYDSSINACCHASVKIKKHKE